MSVMQQLTPTIDMEVKTGSYRETSTGFNSYDNMAQSQVHIERLQVAIINTIKMVLKQVVFIKLHLDTMNMINMVVKQEAIKQVLMELQANATNTEEKRALSKKIPLAELQNMIKTAEKLGVINNV